MSTNRRFLLAVSLPVLVMLIWTLRLSLISSNPVVRLRIEGFDPRDLLSGHYLVYNVNYGEAPSCGELRELCLCLESDDQGFAVSQGEAPSCAELGSCRFKLAGTCDNGRFRAGIERFYFAEASKGELAVVPPDSSIEVALDQGGRGVVRELFVGEVPVREWVKKQEAK